jgi:hypothetical protein
LEAAGIRVPVKKQRRLDIVLLIFHVMKGIAQPLATGYGLDGPGFRVPRPRAYSQYVTAL